MAKNIVEVDRMDEEIASKATAAAAVTGSIPVASVEKKKKKSIPSEDVPISYSDLDVNVEDSIAFVEETDVILNVHKVLMYRLNYRNSNGLIRSTIPKSVVYQLTVHWPDLLRLIPSERWVTVDEIEQLVSRWEMATPRKTIIRKRVDIERGIDELVEAGVLLREYREI
jgi:hypothetical protein